MGVATREQIVKGGKTRISHLGLIYSEDQGGGARLLQGLVLAAILTWGYDCLLLFPSFILRIMRHISKCNVSKV